MVEKTIQLARIAERMIDAGNPEQHREFLHTIQNALIANGYLQGAGIEHSRQFAAFFHDIGRLLKELGELGNQKHS
jgi:predicted HD phosphohydrolase